MKDEFVEINMVPFIDVVLVLIVIVLMTATFVTQGIIPIQPPKSQSDSQKDEDPIVLAVAANGTIYYESIPTSLEELEGLLEQVDKETPVLIKADKDLTLQPFVSLIDAIKGSGFTKIGMQTER